MAYLNNSFVLDPLDFHGQNFSEEPKVDEPHTSLTPEDYIILIGTPIIFIFGITGNTLSAIVMLKEHFRALSTGVYLFSLAIADSIFLAINSMTKNFIVIFTGVDLTKTSWWSCKCYVFLLMTSKCLSAWFIVGVTAERLLIVCLPHKAKVLATRKRAWIAIAAIGFISTCFYSIILFTFGLVPKPWGQDCTMMPEYDEQGLRIFLNTVDLVVYSILPAAILFISNVILIVKVAQSRKWRGQESSTAPSTSASSTDDVTRLTVMLITVSVMFLVCTSPMSLLFLVKAIDRSIKKVPGYYETYRMLYLLQLSNSAINFLLYCLSGPAFRKELKSLFSCCFTKDSRPMHARLQPKGTCVTNTKSAVSTICHPEGSGNSGEQVESESRKL